MLLKSKTIKVAESSHFILLEKLKLSAAIIGHDKRKDIATTTKAKPLIAS